MAYRPAVTGGDTMNYSLLVEDRYYRRKIFECRELVRKVKLTTNRTGSPATLKFELLKAGDISFGEGDPVRFAVDGTSLFYGYVFTKETNRWGEISVTCYDQTRYLKASQSYSFEGMTAGEIIAKIAAEFKLDVGLLEDTGYKIPALICENKSCLDIIGQAVQLTTIHSGKVFVFSSDNGALTLWEAKNMKKEIVIGSQALATGYTYKTDIDSDTYNQIKLAHPNEETGKTDTYIVEDSENMRRWGLLRCYKKVDEELNPAQIKAQANTMLAYYNRVLRTLTINAIGVVGVRAGEMVHIKIPEMGDMNIDEYVLLERVEHSFESERHTMELEARALNGVT